ncbi:MAG: oxidoreductase [Bacteroidetes bacterium]|nr:oxidoreductase [Bacteroidota bacterium]
MQAVIEKIIDETKSVKRFFLKPQSKLTYTFLPGQFLTIRLQDAERSYSIANPADDSGLIELCIVLNPGGKVTPLLWQMQPGEILEISEALGNMVLPETWDKDLCFICTGTGVAPFRSMIGHLLKADELKHDIYLIFGNRYSADILYRAEFEVWAGQNEGFHFIPVLSREEGANRKRYVHAVYEELFADRRDAHFYVCGWEAMCKEARQRLKAMGYNRKQYTFEQYDG